jgi:RecB family exonuclease
MRPVLAPFRLLVALEEADGGHPTERKLLVCRDHGEGRELLRALALRKGGWMGWEAATLRDLAGEMALAGLADRGLRTIDEIEQAALVDAALDEVVEGLGERSVFAPLAEGVGFRRAVADAMEALRLAGIEPRSVRFGKGDRLKLEELARVLEVYGARLEAESLADSAAVLAQALASFDVERPLLAARLFAVPGLGRRGLTGRLLQRLLDAGLHVLTADPVHGLSAPPGLLAAAEGSESHARASSAARRRRVAKRVEDGQLELGVGAPAPAAGPVGERRSSSSDGDSWAGHATRLAWLNAPEMAVEARLPLEVSFFQAASPASEVREVLRRVVAAGRRWDEVEIVATEPVTYGCALDALSTAQGIEVTYALGLPLERNRVGRLLRAYLLWIEGGLHARPIWEALAAGDILPPAVEGGRPGRIAVARALRRLHVGWGRLRYIAARERIRRDLAALSAVESDSSGAEGGERWRPERDPRVLSSLDRLLEQIVKAIPEGMPEDDSGRGLAAARVSAGSLAAGALRMLALFHARTAAEEEALKRVRAVLETVASVSGRRTALASALAELRSHVAIRIPSPNTQGRQPWSSSPGKLHLTDVAHGGLSGRPLTFVVGLDADRTSGGRVQDPILLDSDRQALAPGELPTSADRGEEGRYALAVMLARLRGEVTLSYAGWEASDGSTLSPSPALLQGLRAREGDPTLLFEREPGGPPGLKEILGPPASPVPDGPAAVDLNDVWLDSLAEGPLLLDGTHLVRSSFPMLARGLASQEARAGSVLGSHHGHILGVERLDPRGREDDAISASGLQDLGRCPLAWFYKYALKVRPPQDPEYDPGRWLEGGERGQVLHRIFQRFCEAYRGRQDELGGPDAKRVLLEITDAELDRMGLEVPPPSVAAVAAEREEIRHSALVFLDMELRAERGEWEAFEKAFGMDEQPAVVLPLPEGQSVRVKGRIDRVDRLPDGQLRVIDYKTGRFLKSFEKSAKGPPFAGGRQIQAGVYARVAESAFEASVRRFEYWFPTSRGEHRSVPFEPGELRETGPVVAGLLDMVGAGLFLATDDPEDCRWCKYRDVCRVVVTDRTVTSPRAEWSAAHGPLLPEYARLRRLREER